MEYAESLKGIPGEGPHPAGRSHGRQRISRRAVRKGETDARVRELLREHPRGLTVEEVARGLSASRSSAARCLETLARNGGIEVNTHGRTRVFTLPRRASLNSTLGAPAHLALVLSVDLRVAGVSDPFLAVFRLERGDLVGKRLEDSAFAACAGGRLLGEIRKGTEGLAGLTEFETLVGEDQYTFRARITPLTSGGGPRGVILSLEDITGMARHRRRLEGLMDEETLGLLASNHRLLDEILQRRQREERLELVQSSLDQSAIPVLWVGRDGRFIKVNRAAALILGYQEGELARMAFPGLDLDHPPRKWDSVWETLRTGKSMSFEGRLRTGAGNIIRAEIRASHLVHHGQEYGLFFLEDITQRKRAEEALRESEATQRAFFEANPDPSLLVDRAGRVLLANQAAAVLLGDGTAPIGGTSIFDALPEKAEPAREALLRVLEDRRAGAFAGQISGRYFHTILSPLMDAAGEVDRVAIFARDLTEQKRVEDSLRYVNEKLNLLTAITRHDVLNDITALGMYLELARTDAGSGPGPEWTGRLAPLVRSLQRKMEFTRDYADLGMKMPGWENVAEAVNQAVAGMDLGGVRIDPDLPALEIYADPLFQRVVANLVENTLRHGRHADCIRFGARIEGDSCILSMEDNGVGIPPEQKEHVFRPGFGRNTGLGLFLIREILGITGMDIRETGEPGKGARFEIRIPRGEFRFQERESEVHGDARVHASV